MYEKSGVPREENATFVHLKCRGFSFVPLSFRLSIL